MALNLAAKAPPIFLENYFTRHADKEGDLTLVSGATLRHRLYDMDPRARWQSAGSDDTITETITAGFWLPGVQTTRSFDLLALLNHNVKELTIERSENNGGAYTQIHSDAAIAAANTIVDLNGTQDGDKVRFNLKKTQTANEEKKVGAIVVAKSLLQPTVGLSVYRRHPPTVGHKTAEMADNSTRRSFRFRSDASFTIWGASIGFTRVSESELEDLRDILLHRTDPFVFYPTPGERPGEMYLVQTVPGTYVDNYLVPGVPSLGSVVACDVREVGRA